MNNLTPREQEHLDNAVAYRALRKTCGTVHADKQFDTLLQAQKFASGFGDKRTMIYAVSQFGSAHIMNA
jgi:hypothetical protein